MATRQNKKRKGRNNAPPRERTVTTLTDGPEGSFLPPHDFDDPPSPASVLSPPFSVPAPIAPAAPLAQAPFPLQPFSPSFPYSFAMSPVAAPPFQPQHSPAQFFPAQPQPQPQPIPQPSPAQHALPPGQSDLEILERLKDTIKKNQHELFRPIPQPAALASVYLGPRSAPSLEPSRVPPHPEQLPHDPSPPGLTLLSHDASAAKLNDHVSPANALPQPASRAPPPSPPQGRDASRKPTHRSSVSESPKTNTQQPSKRAADRYDVAHPAKSDSSALNNNGNARHDHAEPSSAMGPPGLHRLEQTSVSRANIDKGVRNEITTSLTTSGEPVSAKSYPLNGKEDSRTRDSAWAPRASYEDRQHSRQDLDRSAPRSVADSPRIGNTNGGTGSETRAVPPRDQKLPDRPTEQDRERAREKERELERDRGRPLRDEPSRFRDDRRNDDRPRPGDNRRSSPDTRRYEPRYPPRRYDSKASDSSFTSPRLADKSPPEPRPTRNLGEERAIVRPPADVSAPRPSLSDERRAPAADDRSMKPPPTVDERRAPVPPPPGPDRPTRVNDDRRPPPPATTDRSARLDDRRPPPSAAASERPGTVTDDRRRPPSPALSERIARPGDDRRVPVPPSPVMSVDRRPVDDRRPAPSVGDRRPPAPPLDDRRPSVSQAADRVGRPVEDRRPLSLGERISSAPMPILPDSVPPRPILEERNPRTAQSEDRSARTLVNRAPSLQERIHPPIKQEERPPPRLEDRISPANVPPSLADRLDNPPVPDQRPLRTQSDDRLPRLPPAAERPAVRAVDDRSILAEPARAAAPVDRPAPHPEDRVFTPSDRYTRPATPAGSDRGHPPPARSSYRAPSVARDEPRTFRPPSPGRSPARADVREFRTAAEARDRLSYRPGPEQDRYAPERRPVPAPAPTPVPDSMDVDPVHPRVPETRLSYRRPSPPPPPAADPYPVRERSWVPAGEYREPEPSRRAEPHTYTRDWHDGERGAYAADDWSERSWERTREYDREREPRFVERDAAPPGWETREERERRAVYPPEPAPPPPPPPARAYPTSLGARLTDPLPYPDERAYAADRGRYSAVVEPPPPPSTYSRVRPRSPSPPPRRGDELRPPMKRARDDPYPAYYPDERPAEYVPRMRTPPPPPSLPPSGGYYDDPRYPPSPPGREREYADLRERDLGGYAPYDRRADPGARMPPLPRSPPPYARAAYGRDDRRY